MLQFRRDAIAVLKQVGEGEAFALTYRGKPVARLGPVGAVAVSPRDPIYDLYKLASPTADPLTSDQIARAPYDA